MSLLLSHWSSSMGCALWVCSQPFALKLWNVTLSFFCSLCVWSVGHTLWVCCSWAVWVCSRPIALYLCDLLCEFTPFPLHLSHGTCSESLRSPLCSLAVGCGARQPVPFRPAGATPGVWQCWVAPLKSSWAICLSADQILFTGAGRATRPGTSLGIVWFNPWFSVVHQCWKGLICIGFLTVFSLFMCLKCQKVC